MQKENTRARLIRATYYLNARFLRYSRRANKTAVVYWAFVEKINALNHA